MAEIFALKVPARWQASILAAVALAALSASVLGGDEPDSPSPRLESRDADSREWARVKEILPGYLWETAPARRAQYEKLWSEGKFDGIRLTKAQFAELAQILRNGSPFAEGKRGEARLLIKTGEKLPDGKDEEMPVKIAVPPKYRPKCGKAFGLVITCHGGPQTDIGAAETASNTQFGLWRSPGNGMNCIVAAPALTGEKWGEREWTFFTNLMKELDRLYNLDYDRVYLTGHSWGGILSWQIGPAYADRFACIAPFVCAVNPGLEYLKNAKNLPIYSVQGAKDIDWIVNDGRDRIKLLKELGYEHEYKEKPGGHESFSDEVARIAEWFSTRPRKLYAKEIVRTGAIQNNSECWYWVKSDSRSFTAKIVDRGTIELDCGGSAEVLLSDEMVDLDGVVKIVHGDKVLWEGKVERRLDFVLQHIRETGDRCRIFAASVTVE